MKILGLGMGVGSQRAAIEDPKLASKLFLLPGKRRQMHFLIANIGGVQLVHGYGAKEVKKAVEMIDADAVGDSLKRLAGGGSA